MATWPATLPALPLAEGYSEGFGDSLLRTPMEVGPAKHRRRISAVAKAMTFPLLLTSAQVDILQGLWDADGSIGFTHTHPRTSAAVTMRMVSEPVAVPRGLQYQVDLELEIMP